jgi:hypothetical protein
LEQKYRTVVLKKKQITSRHDGAHIEKCRSKKGDSAPRLKFKIRRKTEPREGLNSAGGLNEKGKTDL